MAETKKFLAKLTPEDVGGEANCVIFVLGNGVKVRACLDDYSDAIRHKLALHGLSQKIGDSASGCAKDRDFSGAFGNMQTVEDNLRNDTWASRAGGGTSDLVAVLAELQGATLEDAQAAVDKMDEEQLKAVRSNPQVKSAIAELVAARAKEAAKNAAPLDELLKGIFSKK
jgi:hypothetical protein